MEIEQARKECQHVFLQLKPLAKEAVSKYSGPIDDIVKKMSKLDYMSDEEIRQTMMKLSIECYFFGNYTAESALMSDCASVLYKEKNAREYSTASGTQAEKNSVATINSMDKQAVSSLYKMVKDLMGIKLDEAHRLINTLNSVLISRSAEKKIKAGVRDSEEGRSNRA